jgi:hypothetical protein
LPRTLEAVRRAVGRGDLTPSEGQALTVMIDAYRKGLETADLEARLRALEERANAQEKI